MTVATVMPTTASESSERSLLTVASLGVELATHERSVSLLSDVNFALQAGESVGIVGESGAGKSTLALSLLGLLPKRARFAVHTKIAFGGSALDIHGAQTWRPLRGKQIGIVFQEPLLALDPSFTIGDQLEESVAVHGLDQGTAARDRAAAALARVGFSDPADALRRFPHELSGGMRQRALIAAAIVLEPRLLIADEPTTALDVTLQAQVLDLLDELRESMGMALLLISHDLDVVGQRCARAIVLDAGQVAEEGSVTQILCEPKSPAGRRLVAARRVARARPTRSVPETALLTARDVEVRFPAPTSWGSGERRATQAVRGVSLTVHRGEALGIVGESGCGKSSLARALLSLGPLSGGEVRLYGHNLKQLDAAALRALRRRMQFVSQDAGASLTPHCRVRDLVAEGLIVHRIASGAARQRQVDALLERFGLDARIADALPGELSAGQRQRVALARALAVEPDLLVCDEPVSSLDAALRAEVLDHLDALRRERDLSIVMISHDLDAVRRIADRIQVMYHGRIVESGSAADVTATPMMPYTQALLAAEPSAESQLRTLAPVEGQVPSSVARIAGCPFYARCPHSMKDAHCAEQLPPLVARGEGRFVACWKSGDPRSPVT
jgi:peptide/nickel transport system ATP-binding protein